MGLFGGESKFKGKLGTPCEPLGDAIIFKNHDFGHWTWDFFGERANLKEDWGHLVSHWVRKRKVIATIKLKLQFVAVEILKQKQS